MQKMTELYGNHGLTLVDFKGLLGGLAQMPVFLGMFQVLRDAGDGARFLWVPNLLRPDTLLAVIAGLTTAMMMAVNPDMPEQMRIVLDRAAERDCDRRGAAVLFRAGDLLGHVEHVLGAPNRAAACGRSAPNPLGSDQHLSRQLSRRGSYSMKKIIDIALKVVLSLILVLPILGTLGIFPPPTQDLYNTPEAFQFIAMLTEIRYINIIMSVVHVIALFCLWTRRTALAALLVLPITVNVVAFHLVLDGGLLTGGAVLGNIMLLINLYFLWTRRRELAPLWAQTT